MLSLLRLTLLAAVMSPVFLRANVDQRIEALKQDALQEAFRVLQRDYIRDLSYEELNRAALDGLLRRLGPGAELVSKSASGESTEPRVPFASGMLLKDAGYIRLASYQEGELAQLDKALNELLDADAKTLILDLRATQSSADLNTAARILDRFVPSNTPLFKIQKPRDKRPTLFFSQVANTRWKNDLILLVDSETSNAGEVIAAVIASQRECLIAGAQTKGVTVQYEQIPLDEKTYLRFAVAEVVLQNGSSLFKVGVTPEYVLAEELDQKHKVFALSKDAPLKNYLFDEARPRMNEAALVHETDPELDYHLAKARGEQTKYDQVPVQDRMLQRVVDLLIAQAHLQAAKKPDEKP